jgi:hypothetical protein
MKKILTLTLSALMLMATLVACDEKPTESQNSKTTTQGNENTSSGERIVPTSFDGIYVNDSETHYVVIEGDHITIDDNASSSISIKENEAIESAVYSFSYDGKEETFFKDNGSFMCSIDAEEGVHYCWSKVDEIPQLPVEEKGPLWLQGGGSTFALQLKTDLVTEMKNTAEKIMRVDFFRADESYKMALVISISQTDGTYSGYISDGESGEAYNGDLVFVKDGFINFRFDSTIYPLFSDIDSYCVALLGGDQSTYKFENCTGGDFTAQTDSTSQFSEPNQTYDTSFLGKEYTYRVNYTDGTFQDDTIKLTKVDASGNLIEIEYNGYTIALSNVSSEYDESEYHHFVRFEGSCPGYFIQIQYTYMDAPEETSQNPPDTVYLTTGWGEGHDKNMPVIRDGTFIKTAE